MYVRNVLEVVGAVLRYEKRDGDGFDGGVAPAVVVDAAGPVDVVDIVAVLRRSPHVEVGEFEVVPEDAAARPAELGSDGALPHVVVNSRPQTDYTRPVVRYDCREPVLDTTVAHQSEDVVTDGAGDVGVVVQSPDVLQSVEDRLLV